MGLLDGNFDPDQFGEGGGLLGRLLSLRPDLGRNQQGPGFDQSAAAPQTPALLPWPISVDNGQTPSASLTSAPDLHSQYQALRLILGDRNAMLATVHPEVGQTLVAQALANQRGPGNSGGAPSAADSRPVVSDATPDPIRPGSQYAQAPLALCAAGPAGCAAGAGITAGQLILGGAALGGLGAAIMNNDGVSRPPAGSRSIDKTPWSGDHAEIKEAVGAQGNDDVRTSPMGDVWAQKPDGSWENHGPADTFTGSGKPSGRRGKDRDRWQ